MAIYYSNLDYESPERFDLGKFLEFNVDNFDVLNSFFLDEFVKLPYVGNFVVQNEELAPDYISRKLYNRHEYWWLLMFYNNITDFKKIKTGLVLKIFSLSDLESLYFKMKSLEVLKGTDEANGSISSNATLAASSSTPKDYVFSQIILSDTWVINHTLGVIPSVAVLKKNTNGDSELLGSGDYTVIFPAGKETSQVIIVFPVAIRGKVILTATHVTNVTTSNVVISNGGFMNYPLVNVTDVTITHAFGREAIVAVFENNVEIEVDISYPLGFETTKVRIQSNSPINGFAILT